MMGKRVNTHTDLFPDRIIPIILCLDHSQLQKSQESLETANHVTRKLLTRTAHGLYTHFNPLGKHPRNACGNIILPLELGLHIYGGFTPLASSSLVLI